MSTRMKEAKRWPGSEWLKNHPRPLERAYIFTRGVAEKVLPALFRLSPRATQWSVASGERGLKGYIFNCQMCGQCILHSTGMTCPMNCPKKLRNGPCGGTRHNGHCEVIEEKECVWQQAWRRGAQGRYGDELMMLQPPVDWRLQDTSAWLSMIQGLDTNPPDGWKLGAGQAKEGTDER